MSSMGRMSEEAYALMCKICKGEGTVSNMCPTCKEPRMNRKTCKECKGTGEIN